MAPRMYRYEFDGVPVRQATAVEVRAVVIDLTKDESAQVEITWDVYDGDRAIGVRVSRFSIRQFETFAENYASFTGDSFEQKVLNLAPNQIDGVPDGGAVVSRRGHGARR